MASGCLIVFEGFGEEEKKSQACFRNSMKEKHPVPPEKPKQIPFFCGLDVEGWVCTPKSTQLIPSGLASLAGRKVGTVASEPTEDSESRLL